MLTRRDFLKSSGLMSAGLMLNPSLNGYDKSVIGLQLYTVRDAMQADPAATLAKVASVGYNSVENATYTGTQLFYGLKPAEYLKLLKQNGLKAHSGHYRLGEELTNGAATEGTILHNWQKTVDDAAAIGLEYMVCAYLSAPERGDLDHYKKIAESFNKAGETCRKANIQFCYHNHDFEFEKQGSEYPYSVLLNATDKDLVKMEMDIYWVTKAGQDPLKLFAEQPDRFPLWHVKDMDNTAAHNYTEVGNGTINFKQIFAKASTAGMKYYFVEQDKCPGSPYDSIKKSFGYIKSNLT